MSLPISLGTAYATIIGMFAEGFLLLPHFRHGLKHIRLVALIYPLECLFGSSFDVGGRITLRHAVISIAQ